MVYFHDFIQANLILNRNLYSFFMQIYEDFEPFWVIPRNHCIRFVAILIDRLEASDIFWLSLVSL